MKTRRAGLLLHVTSLPSPWGIGDLGEGAYRFVDFLSGAGQGIWQVLPLNPSTAAYGNSPYSSYSAYAGNPLLISPGLLQEWGYLLPSDLEGLPFFPPDRVEFDSVFPHKSNLLRTSFERFKDSGTGQGEFNGFCADNACWLDDYALFVALKTQFNGVAWNEWPRDERERVGWVLDGWRERLADRILSEKFYQYLFFKQWFALKKYCNARSIQIIGDLPIYVSLDSVDVWANPEVFKLDEEKKPLFVAGVPPDYFSDTGQLWGNPVYNWDGLRQNGYGWWVRRVGHNLQLFDIIRLDHFRGFVGFWEVPHSEQTAVNGRWVEAPARDFFNALLRRFSTLPIVAEDLGIITPEVREIMHAYGFPGMKVLQFAFGGDLATNPYAPHNHAQDCCVYSGTHDNNTTRGWFENEVHGVDRERMAKYLGRTLNEEEIHWELVRLSMISVANTCIIPMQDVLGLGAECRMNTPSITHGNWEWRVTSEQMTPDVSQRLLELTSLCGRT